MTAPGPFRWPEGKSCAVVLTVIHDAGLDAVAQAPDLLDRSKSFSVWEYGGRRGVDRLAETFAEAGVRTTWQLPSIAAEASAAQLRALVADGHELASRGIACEDFAALAPAQAREVVTASCDAIGDLVGNRPIGFRLPRGTWPRYLSQTLTEAGILWSSSLNGDDVPYRHDCGLVEIPVHSELEDRPYFQFNFTPPFPVGLSRIASYDGVLHNWTVEFDAYRRYGLCFVLQLRPEIIGTPGRIFILQDLLRHIRTQQDVWVTTAGDVADWCRRNAADNAAEHPLEVYGRFCEEDANG